MPTLSICNLQTAETAPLRRDVCHTHAAWVHAQLGTASESELQEFLDHADVAEYAAQPGQPDESGIFVAVADAMDELGDDPYEALVKGLIKAGKTLEDFAAAVPGSRVIDGCWVPCPGTFITSTTDEVEYEAATPKEAAEQHAADFYEAEDETQFIEVAVWRHGFDADGDAARVGHRTFSIAVDPQEPECTHEDGHDWRSPIEIVGGIEENPGVQGNGGGVVIEQVCMRCGCKKTTDTWAQNPATGEQGLTSIKYTPGHYAEEVAALAAGE